jgi:hypothetical protein
MALIPERIFEKYLLTESEPFLPHTDVDMDQRYPGSGSSSQASSQAPMLGQNALDIDSQQGSPQFETLQNCQPPPPGQQYHNEDSQQSNFEVGGPF